SRKRHTPHISAASARLKSAMFLRRIVLLALFALVAFIGPGRLATAQAPAPQAPQPPAPTSLAPAVAQPAMPASGSLQIVWEVKNRFRLFREERDFKLHADYLRSHSILESEDALAVEGEGRGWARNMFRRLCIDQSGKISQPCSRDNVGED